MTQDPSVCMICIILCRNTPFRLVSMCHTAERHQVCKESSLSTIRKYGVVCQHSQINVYETSTVLSGVLEEAVNQVACALLNTWFIK